MTELLISHWGKFCVNEPNAGLHTLSQCVGIDVTEVFQEMSPP